MDVSLGTLGRRETSSCRLLLDGCFRSRWELRNRLLKRFDSQWLFHCSLIEQHRVVHMDSFILVSCTPSVTVWYGVQLLSDAVIFVPLPCHCYGLEFMIWNPRCIGCDFIVLLGWSVVWSIMNIESAGISKGFIRKLRRSSVYLLERLRIASHYGVPTCLEQRSTCVEVFHSTSICWQRGSIVLMHSCSWGNLAWDNALFVQICPKWRFLEHGPPGFCSDVVKSVERSRIEVGNGRSIVVTSQ